MSGGPFVNGIWTWFKQERVAPWAGRFVGTMTVAVGVVDLRDTAV